VSVGQGYDPRGFLSMAYGGTLPMFAMQIAAALDIQKVAVPRGSSVFCAGGLLAADFLQRHDQAVGWVIDDDSRLDSVNRLIAHAESQAIGSMRDEGFAASEIGIVRTGHFHFKGQVHELPMTLPSRPLTRADGQRLADAFRDVYERVYGEGTAWRGAMTQLVSVTVTVTGRVPRPGPRGQRAQPG
jgi:N-methylhydantoinase A